jgi:hypothetical protein
MSARPWLQASSATQRALSAIEAIAAAQDALSRRANSNSGGAGARRAAAAAASSTAANLRVAALRCALAAAAVGTGRYHPPRHRMPFEI